MISSQIKKIDTDWKNILEKFTTDLEKIDKFIDSEIKTYEPILKILPPMDKIFNAFNYFNIQELKVVIIGQDCYHGRNQANGLCFSVSDDIKNPPSLRNIIKEMSNDIGKTINSSDFTYLAKQGILFLNSALTVREKCAGSHLPIWINFTDNIIKEISNNCNNILFILWGNFAKNKKKIIDLKKHNILEATHPSPLSANRGGFFGCKHFSKTNDYLKSINKEPISW